MFQREKKSGDERKEGVCKYADLVPREWVHNTVIEGEGVQMKTAREGLVRDLQLRANVNGNSVVLADSVVGQLAALYGNTTRRRDEQISSRKRRGQKERGCSSHFSSARTSALLSSNNIAVLAIGQTGRKRRLPLVIAVVDDNISNIPPSKRDLVAIPLFPVLQRVRADFVVKADHAGDGGPTMLALPSIGAGTVVVASAVVAVWCTVVAVAEQVAGEDGRSAVRVGEGEDVGESVPLGGRLVREVAAALAIVVDDEDVGFVGG